MTGQFHIAQAALYLCVFLHLFTEMLFAPFFPQFFSQVFGVAEIEFTGLYVAVCRLTVVACAPVWAWLSRQYETWRLLLISQLGTAAFTACLPVAVNETQFLLLSVGLLAFKSGYLLVYSLAVELGGKQRQARTVGTYQGLFHLAIIASTLASAWAIQLDEPLRVFYVVALLDLVQAVLCFYALGFVGSRRVAPTARKGSPRLYSLLIPVGFLIFTFHLAGNVIRPYFTVFATAESSLALPVEVSAVLFFLPSAVALAITPAVRRLGSWRYPNTLYILAVALLGASTFLQGMAQDFATLLVGRVIFGLFFVVAQALIEMRLFRGSGADLHFNYGVIVAVQNSALLAAPVLASALVGAFGLAAPLIGAAAIYALNLMGYRAAFAVGARLQTASTLKEEKNGYAGRSG